MSPAKDPDKYMDELEREIARLQTALAFWMPAVPADWDEQIVERLGDDTFLLCGFRGEIPKDTAESLGWITLNRISGSSSESRS